jgi:type IV pilus assembly protein PilW
MKNNHFKAALRCHIAGGQQQRGYSLIELMISITLGLIIISGLLVVYVNSSASSKTNDRTAEVMSNARFAIDTLKGDLRAAGFRGYSWAEPNAPTSTLTPITNECLETGASAGAFVSNIRQGIWGSKDSNPFSSNCIPSTHYARGDVLVVRKLSPIAVTALAADRFYFRSNYAAGEVFRGTPTTACPAPQSTYAAPYNKEPCLAGTPGVDLLNFPIEIHVYFIRRYTDTATELPLTPALCRVTLRSDGSMAEEVIASGIEDMRIQYARTLTNQTTQYFEADSISGGSTATTITDWDDVNAARIWLLARNANTEPGYVNTTVYSLGSSTFPRSPTANPNGDGFRRQLFNTVVQLRN